MPIDVGAVVDCGDEDGVLSVVDAQQYSVVATAGTVVGGEFLAQWFAESMRVVREWTGDEFDDRGGDFMRQTMQVAPCRAGNLDAI